MEFRILGPLEVLDGGESIDLGPFKQRSLLALLLINANEVVSTDRIIEALWCSAGSMVIPPTLASRPCLQAGNLS